MLPELWEDSTSRRLKVRGGWCIYLLEHLLLFSKAGKVFSRDDVLSQSNEGWWHFKALCQMWGKVLRGWVGTLGFSSPSEK